MTAYAACANGNLTSSSTWAAIDGTSFNRSSAARSFLTTSFVASSTFTPGAITVDGIGVWVGSKAALPSGTVTAELFNSTDSLSVDSTTINVADLAAGSYISLECGWHFFKFASSHFLIAGKAYSVRLKTSVGSQVEIMSNSGTNWSRFLRTTTNAAPTTGDDLLIQAEYTGAGARTDRTVTMNSTAATDYGSAQNSTDLPALALSQGGTLSCGTAASTAYIFRISGYVLLYNGGTFAFGTVAAPVPRGSTADFQIDCGFDGQFAVYVENGGNFIMQGQSRTSGKNITRTKLTANAAVSATTLNVANDTGWLSGDQIVIAPTEMGTGTPDVKTLSGNAGASSMTLGSGLARSKLGTAPLRAGVALITRNVSMHATNASFRTAIYFNPSAVCDCDWAEFYYLGNSTPSKQGFQCATTTGSVNIDYCSFHEFNGWTFHPVPGCTGNWAVRHSVFYKTDIPLANDGGGTNWIFDDNIAIQGFTSPLYQCSFFGSVGGTFTSNEVAAAPQNGAYFNVAGTLGTFSGNEFYSCGASGVFWNALAKGIFATATSWHNGSSGYRPVDGIIFDTCAACGNDLGATKTNWWYEATGIVRNALLNCTASGTTTNATTYGIEFDGGAGATGNYYITVIGTDLVGATSGVLAKSSYAARCSQPGQLPYIDAENCKLTGTSGLIDQLSTLVWDTVFEPYNLRRLPLPTSLPYIKCQRLDQTDANHQAFYPTGTVKTNAATFHTAAPSEELKPLSASIKLESGRFLIPSNDGETRSVTVYVRKDSSYNGSAPRLMMRRQDSIGIAADTVCDALSVGVNTWEALTYMTPAANEDGAFEFYVDCDGTAGSIFVDDVIAA
jgi:hypothetical protein